MKYSHLTSFWKNEIPKGFGKVMGNSLIHILMLFNDDLQSCNVRTDMRSLRYGHSRLQWYFSLPGVMPHILYTFCKHNAKCGLCENLFGI